MKITNFQKFILQKIFKKLVRQSWDHENNIVEIFKILREAVDEEFTEDNDITRDYFIADCLNKTQSKYYYIRRRF